MPRMVHFSGGICLSDCGVLKVWSEGFLGRAGFPTFGRRRSHRWRMAGIGNPSVCCQHDTPVQGPRICPLCGHVFQGNRWDGIHAHWRAHHAS